MGEVVCGAVQLPSLAVQEEGRGVQADATLAGPVDAVTCGTGTAQDMPQAACSQNGCSVWMSGFHTPLHMAWSRVKTATHIAHPVPESAGRPRGAPRLPRRPDGVGYR